MTPSSLLRALPLSLAVSLAALGCALDPADEGEEDSAADEAAVTSGACPSKATAGDYVLCVTRRSATGAERLIVKDRAGRQVFDTEVTLSNVDEGNGDGVTCDGRRQLLNYAVRSPSGLEDFFLMSGGNGNCTNQGLHYYKNVGANYDSHGCVRLPRRASDWLADRISPLVYTQKIYVYIPQLSGGASSDNPSSGQPSGCLSQTLGRWVDPGTCVQRAQDQLWYRCVGNDDFVDSSATDALCRTRIPL